MCPYSVSTYTLPQKIFGCAIYPHIHKIQWGKLNLRAHKHVFMGYFQTQKGYKCYDPSQRKVIVSLDVIFNKIEPVFKIQLQGEKTSEDDFCSGPLVFLDNLMPDHDLLMSTESLDKLGYHEPNIQPI